MFSLLRVDASAELIAKNFAAFCKRRTVITKHVRLGQTVRQLRGVIATRNIPAGENLITVPTSAMLSFVDALNDQTFTSVFGTAAETLLTPENMSERVFSSFLMRTHVVLASYMVHVMLTKDYERHDVLKYIDYLPRGESPFMRLTSLLRTALDTDANCQMFVDALAKKHYVDVVDVRDVLIWALCMVFSRSMPLDHEPTVAALIESAPKMFIEALRRNKKLAIPCLVPVLDMCNHSVTENAAVMVPDRPMQYARCVVVRSVRSISEGEEVVLTYGAGQPIDTYGLFYGFDTEHIE